MTTQKNNPAESTADREIVTVRVVDAPRELVWEALTKPEHIVNWWGPRGFSTTIETMDFREGGTWKFVMHGPDGTDYPNMSTFLKIVKPERIVYSHGDGKKGARGIHFEMTWTFEIVEKVKTKVTIHHVFPTKEARDRVVKDHGAAEGGKQTLERLSEHLEAMADAPEFVISRVFDAPRELVWKAWTEPSHLAKWWGPRVMKTPVCDMDLRPGGKYRIVMRAPDGLDYPMAGVYRDIVPSKRLVMTVDCTEHPAAWHNLIDQNRKGNPNPAGEMLMTVTFEKMEKKTNVTVRMRMKSGTILKSMVKMGMNEGWSESLDRLGELLAKK